MAAPPLHVVDYLVLVFLNSLGIGVGLYASFRRRRLKTVTASGSNGDACDVEPEESFLGSRRLYAIPLAMSMFASAVTSTAVVSFAAHFYMYGLHVVWCAASTAIVAPLVAHTFVPVVYGLRLTSVFQYLRMRYNNAVGVTACVIYFFLSEIVGGLAICSCSLALSTILGASFITWNAVIGLVGTTYTVLGKIRGVVWTDTVQGLVMFASPVTVVAKIAYDSYSEQDHIQRRSIWDFDFRKFLFQTDFSLSNDETVWAILLGLVPFCFVRYGIDQTVAQRYLSARSLQDAQRVAYRGCALAIVFLLVVGVMALSLVYWHRDCDPVLAGAIARYDQIVPYHINENLSGLVGLRGIFLAGVTGAATSTVSSIINSHAAIFYVDVITPYFATATKRSSYVICILALASGVVMTAFATLLPYLGTAARVTIVICNSISGPLSGLFILALWFPWSNTKGATCATLLALALQLWHSVGRSFSGIEPPRVDVSLNRCPYNVTAVPAGLVPSVGSDVFPLYRVSAPWMSVLSVLFTVAAGLVISLATGSRKEVKRNLLLSSGTIVRIWRCVGLLRREAVVPEASIEAPNAKEATLLLPISEQKIGTC